MEVAKSVNARTSRVSSMLIAAMAEIVVPTFVDNEPAIIEKTPN
jgi:hypothetical protein